MLDQDSLQQRRGLKRTHSSGASLNSMNLDTVEEEPHAGYHHQEQELNRPFSPFASSKHVLSAPSAEYLEAIRNSDKDRLIRIMKDLPPLERKLRGLLARLWIGAMKNKNVEAVWHSLQREPHVISDTYFWEEMGLFVAKHPFSGIRSDVIQTVLEVSDASLRSAFFERLLDEGVRASDLVEEFADPHERNQLYERLTEEYALTAETIKAREDTAMWIGNNVRTLDRQSALHPYAHISSPYGREALVGFF
jgi:hypothetical protein